MPSIKARVMRQDSKYLEAVKGYENSARSVVAYGLNETRNIAVKGITEGNKSGRTYTRGGKTHTASAAGEYPASDSGTLVNNIYTVTDSNGLGS